MMDHMGKQQEEPAGTTARQVLKQATDSDHRALEALPCMATLLAADVSRGAYARVLAAFYTLHDVLEPHAARAAGRAACLDGRRRAALAADLEELGLAAAPPRPPSLPAFDGAAPALGACYVIEGSLLGAPVISAHLRRHLGAQLPLRYFGAANIDAAARWQQFLAQLESDLPTPRARGEAVDGARRTYRWLHALLASVPGPASAAP
jgi:heme oxygenase